MPRRWYTARFATRLLGVVCMVCSLAAALAVQANAEPMIVDLEVGFAGEYKLGLWAPATVTVKDAADLQIEVVAPDSDGVGVRYTASVGSSSGQQTTPLLIRVGRRDAPLTVRLRSQTSAQSTSSDDIVAQATFSPTSNSTEGGPRSGRPSTSRIVAELTAASAGRVASDSAPSSLLAAAVEESRLSQTSVARLGAVSDLPTRWIGYESLACLWINFSDLEFAGQLLGDSARATALSKWVHGGGRVVIGVGQESAELFANDGARANEAWAGLLPGEFAEIISLNDAGPFETYASSTKPIAAGQGVAIPVTKFTSVQGRIEAYAGSQPTDLPLVVRRRVGFGEVVLVTVDLAAVPFATWEGLGGFVARVSGLDRDGSRRAAGDAPSQIVTTGYNDLSGAVQHRLGATFTGVSTVSMLAIVAAALLYLVLIGPGDYFFLKQIVGRMELTWLTLPLMVLLFGGGAYWLSNQLRGEAPQLNRLELIDVDGQSGIARSVLWAQAYSPTATRHDLRLVANAADGATMASADGYLSWLGMPGRGMGGLDTSATAFSPLGAEYRQGVWPGGSRLPLGLQGVPINTASTKALMSRWQGITDRRVEADLTRSSSGLPEGALINATGADFLAAWLVAGDWAWRLGPLPDGATISIDASRPPLTLKTLIRRDFLKTRGANAPPGQQAAQTKDLGDYDLDGLAALVMFTDALGGEITQLENHFLPFTDLSSVFDWDQAVLVARLSPSAGTRIHSGKTHYAAPADKSRVYYRYLLEVGRGQ